MKKRALSRREREIVQLASAGLTDKEIALRLNLSMGTINTYWVRTRQKLNVSSRAACVAALIKRGRLGQSAETCFSELRWRALFEASAQGVLLISREYVVLEANPQALENLEVRADELVGRAIPFVDTDVRTLEGVCVPPDEYPIVRCFLTSEPTVEEEFRIVRPDKPSLCIRVSARPLIDGENPPSEVLVLLDRIVDPCGHRDAERRATTTMGRG